jgi:PTH1 family peptidyl-tRNA hydrolase
VGISQVPGNVSGRQSPFLICGLGNPGPKYARNRHNAGFQCVDRLAQQWKLSFERMRFRAYLALGQALGFSLILAKPLTFMNDSGESVASIARWYKIPVSNLLVIYDDLDLPLGKVRLRPGGSSGGHKGMTSIITHLGSDAFPRLRMGIGRPIHGEPYEYVLSDFTKDQSIIMQDAYTRGQAAIECLLTQGVEIAMSKFNQ